MSFTAFLEQKLLNHVYRGVTYTAPASVYLGLFTVAPAADGTGGTEVTGGGYARQLVAFGAPTGASPSQVANTGTVQYPTASGSWGTVVGAGVFDAVTGGNLLDYGTLTTAKTVSDGDTFVFDAANITASLT